jgi:hypothetical protein
MRLLTIRLERQITDHQAETLQKLVEVFRPDLLALLGELSDADLSTLVSGMVARQVDKMLGITPSKLEDWGF